MSPKTTTNSRTRLAQKVPLRLVLVIPFVLQIFATVALVGYLSLRNGQKSVLVSLLEPIGFEVVEASNGQFGLQKARDRPDLIITDLSMPVMDGFEMMHHLRHTPELKDIPIIVSSEARI